MEKEYSKIVGRTLQDLFRLLFLAGILGSALTAAISVPGHARLGIDLSIRLFVFFAFKLLMIALFRELIPRPQTGSHIIGYNRAYLSYLASSAFADTAALTLVRFPFWSFHTTRILYLKAMGARIPWNCGFHISAVAQDPTLLSMASGAEIESGIVIETALHRAGRVRIAPVAIGERSVLGSGARVMPGASLGHDVRIESMSVIGEDVRIGVSSIVHVDAHLKKCADIGAHVSIGAGSILLDNVVVGDRASVKAGAIVSADSEIGEREQWAGVPATHQAPVFGHAKDPRAPKVVHG